MSEVEEKSKKSFDARENHADNIIWKRLKDQAKELEYGSFQVKVTIHASQIREIEIYDTRQKTRVV